MKSQSERLFVGGRPLKYDPNRLLGKGGEGMVLDLADGRAMKLYLPPDHPDYAGNDPQQVRDRKGAEYRLRIIGQKLAEYPATLRDHPRIIAPLEPVTDEHGVVKGYTMKALPGADVLRDYCRPGWRRNSGVDNATITPMLIELHRTVCDVHTVGEIGDFNYLGVLVKQLCPFLIDADSIQFGNFQCRSATPRFVDPLVCSPDELVLAKRHTKETDWYAFALMLLESWLFAGPYSGVLIGDLAKTMKNDDRPFKRVWFRNKDVHYPDKAIPYGNLSDPWLEFYQRLIEKDERGTVPIKLLENTRWVTCSGCGAQHCRAKCPVCTVASPAVVPVDMVDRRGKVTATRYFSTPGVILDAVYADGGLRYLYHEDHAFYRDGRKEVGRGDLEPGLITKITGDATIFAYGGTLSIDTSRDKEKVAVDMYRSRYPIVDTTGTDCVWIDGGRILRRDGPSKVYLGSVLSGQTMLWIGSRFGFFTYRVGDIRRAGVFPLKSAALNDSVELPPTKGDPLEADCTFSSQRCWFFTVYQERGRTINRCSVIDASGNVTASAEAPEGDGTWLGSGHGRCAVDLPRKGQEPLRALFVVMDDGLVRVDEVGTDLVATRNYPDTKGLVRSDDRLVTSNEGIFLWGEHEVRLLKMG